MPIDAVCRRGRRIDPGAESVTRPPVARQVALLTAKREKRRLARTCGPTPGLVASIWRTASSSPPQPPPHYRPHIGRGLFRQFIHEPPIGVWATSPRLLALVDGSGARNFYRIYGRVFALSAR